MSSVPVKHVPVSEAMRAYLARSCSPLDPVVAGLVEKTAALGDQAGMMVPAEQAALLTLLAATLGARTAVDVGTFTGLSALALARGLAPGGKVITCDVSDAHTDLAREYWELAGVADRVDFRMGAAGRTLAGLAADLAADLVFIDADKMNYPTYHTLAVPLLRPGGLLIADNVFLDGYVMDPDLAGDSLMRSCARQVRAFNAALAADDRLDVVMLPIADGLTIARKR